MEGAKDNKQTILEIIANTKNRKIFNAQIEYITMYTTKFLKYWIIITLSSIYANRAMVVVDQIVSSKPVQAASKLLNPGISRNSR